MGAVSDPCANPGSLGLGQVYFPIYEMGMIVEPTLEGVVSSEIGQSMSTT